MSALDLSAAMAALAPVRAAVLRQASADADRILAEAEADAAAALAQPRARARDILASAAAQGEADAAAMLAAERSRARRSAREAELAAQREAYEDLRRRVAVAVLRLRDDAGYPALRERLAARARAALGPDAEITDAPGGGVIGTAPGRRLDLSLAAVADHAIDLLGTEVEALWAP